MKYILSDPAERDVEGILEYTSTNWGVNQAKKYISLLGQGLRSICENPKGVYTKPRSEIQKGLRSLKVEKHVVFYNIKRDCIEIVRILHVSMDFESHFE